MFTEENPDINHPKIFSFPIFIHVTKEKISKLDPLVNKGIFVGYSDQSKAYGVYIPGYRHININRDAIFYEDTNFSKSRKNHADEDHEEEHEATRVE